jgi:hypothetical protein
MRTPIEEFIEFVEKFAKFQFTDHEKQFFRMKEKIDQQLAYNAGFSKAKELYFVDRTASKRTNEIRKNTNRTN